MFVPLCQTVWVSTSIFDIFFDKSVHQIMRFSKEFSIYALLFSLFVSAVLALGYFIFREYSSAEDFVLNDVGDGIFADFPISNTITVILEGKGRWRWFVVQSHSCLVEIKALKGEAEDFESAKFFCRSRNASFPRNKLDFPNNEKQDYFVEVEDKSAVSDPNLLEVLKTVESDL